MVKDEGLHQELGWLVLDWAMPRLVLGDLKRLGIVAAAAVREYSEVWRHTPEAACKDDPADAWTWITLADQARLGPEIVAQHVRAPLADIGIRWED